MAHTGEQIDSRIPVGNTKPAAEERQGAVEEDREGEAEHEVPVPEPQVVDDDADRRTQTTDAQAASTDGIFGAR